MRPAAFHRPSAGGAKVAQASMRRASMRRASMRRGIVRTCIVRTGIVGALLAVAVAPSSLWASPVANAAPASVVPAAPASPAATVAPPAVTKGPDSLSLLSESLWVGPAASEFKLHLSVSAAHEATESLAVLVYGALSARSEFQEALGGNAVGGPIYNPGAVPLSHLAHDPSGGVDVALPLGPSTGGAWPPAATGVYPVQVLLEDALGARLGSPLDTFLVYAAKGVSDLKRLGVGVVVPMSARVPISEQGAAGPLPSSAATGLDGDAEDIAASKVPVTIRPDVPTLEAMGAGTARDRKALAGLDAAVRGGDQVLAGTKLPVDVASFAASGFSQQLGQEISAGAGELGAIFGRAPGPGTWAFLADVGPSTPRALSAFGGRRFVLPAGDLTGLPANAEDLTWAQPTELNLGRKRGTVLGADSELSSRVAQATGSGSTLVAYQVLAELAMIDLEKPSVTRGVVVMPPPRTIIDPTFLSILLQGLADNPLLDPMTVAQLFANVPLGQGPSGVVVQSVAPQKPARREPGAQSFSAAEAAVAVDASSYGASFPEVAALSRQLTISLSSWWSAARRSSMIGSVLTQANAELHLVHLPPSTSITLTSRRGQLPLTLISNAPAPMKVLLVLDSEQLGFLPTHFASGPCATPTPGTEDCHLTVTHTITLNVPVEVRSIGTFPIAVSIESPDGSTVIAASTDIVRSTAFSDVGLGLMIGAAVFLGVWWVRNARHGRRARKLVPRPGDGPGPEDLAPGHVATPVGNF